MRVLGILSVAALALTANGNDTFSYKLPVGNPPPRYRLVIKDNPAAGRFELTMHSRDHRMICLDRGSWPNQDGHIDWGSQWVKVQSKKRSFPARDWNFGSCEGEECTIRVPAQGKLVGFIRYSEFGDPKEIAALPKRRVHFNPLVFVCP
jgi:hypothetical protein